MRRRDFPWVIAALNSPGFLLNARADIQEKRAMLVGIDTYANPDIPTLSGCQNDVEGMRNTLVGSYGFPEKNVLMLVNAKASYRGIRDAFQNHLMNVSTGGAVVIQFSGHGSRQPSSTSASGQGETIVPHDSRNPKNLDITSEALSAMLAELAKRTKNITIILDSCHSGRMVAQNRTAVSTGQQVRVRQIPPASDVPPPPPFGLPTRALAPTSGFAPLDGSYVLMASVLASQLAKEYTSGSKQFGAMTFFLLRELASAAPKVTNRNIMDVVRQRVSEAVDDQTPQIVGPHADNYLFGIASPSVVPYTIVRRTAANVLLPYAGTASGISEGSRYDVYTFAPQPGSSPAATIQVTKSDSFSSEARALTGTVPELGYGVLRDRGIQVGRLALWVDPSPTLDIGRADLQKDPSIQLVASVKDANLRLRPESGGMGLYTPDGLAMYDRKSPIPNSAALRRELGRWANWFAMQGLNNPQTAIRIELRFEAASRSAGSLPQLGLAEMTVKEGSVYVPVVVNKTDSPLYMTLLGLSSDRSIDVIFPAKADVNAAFEVKPKSERRLPALQAQIPPCLDSSRDVLLLFASTQPVGFFPYVQDGFCQGKTRTMTPVGKATPQVIPGPGMWATARRVVQIQK